MKILLGYLSIATFLFITPVKTHAHSCAHILNQVLEFNAATANKKPVKRKIRWALRFAAATVIGIGMGEVRDHFSARAEEKHFEQQLAIAAHRIEDYILYDMRFQALTANNPEGLIRAEALQRSYQDYYRDLRHRMERDGTKVHLQEFVESPIFPAQTREWIIRGIPSESGPALTLSPSQKLQIAEQTRKLLDGFTVIELIAQDRENELQTLRRQSPWMNQAFTDWQNNTWRTAMEDRLEHSKDYPETERARINWYFGQRALLEQAFLDQAQTMGLMIPINEQPDLGPMTESLARELFIADLNQAL